MSNLMNKESANIIIEQLNLYLSSLNFQKNKLNEKITYINVYNKIVDKIINNVVLSDEDIIFLKENIEKTDGLTDIKEFFKNDIKKLDEFLELRNFIIDLDSKIDVIADMWKVQYYKVKPILTQEISKLKNIDIQEYVSQINDIDIKLTWYDNILKFINGDVSILKEEDYKLFGQFLNENVDLDENTKKCVYLDFVSYLFDKIDLRKKQIDELKTSIITSNVENKIQDIFSDNQDILANGKKEEIIESIEESDNDISDTIDEEFNIKKEELTEMLNCIFEYLGKVDDIILDYNIDFESNDYKNNQNLLYNLFNSSYNVFKSDNDPKIFKQNLNMLLNDSNINLLYYFMFDKCFNLYSTLKDPELDYIFNIYKSAGGDVDNVLNSLSVDNFNDTFNLIKNVYDYFLIATVDLEFEKYYKLCDILFDSNNLEDKNLIDDDNPIEDDDLSTLIIKNTTNFNKNMVVFCEPTFEETKTLTNLNDSFIFFKKLLAGLINMRDRNYNTFNQKSRNQKSGESKNGISEYLRIKESLRVNRYRQSTVRIAYIFLNVSGEVKKFIKASYGIELDNKGVLLVYSFANKISDDREIYNIFNSYLGKKRINSRNPFIKNRLIFDIVDLFNKKDLTDYDKEQIKTYIESGKNIYSSMIEELKEKEKSEESKDREKSVKL